jgi:hypothetical protein
MTINFNESIFSLYLYGEKLCIREFVDVLSPQKFIESTNQKSASLQICKSQKINGLQIANSDDSMSMTTYSQKPMPIQIQGKPTAWLLLRTITEE